MNFLIIVEKHQMQKDFGQTLQRHNGGVSGCLILSNILFLILLWICVELYMNLKFSLCYFTGTYICKTELHAGVEKR